MLCRSSTSSGGIETPDLRRNRAEVSRRDGTTSNLNPIISTWNGEWLACPWAPWALEQKNCCHSARGCLVSTWPDPQVPQWASFGKHPDVAVERVVPRLVAMRGACFWKGWGGAERRGCKWSWAEARSDWSSGSTGVSSWPEPQCRTVLAKWWVGFQQGWAPWEKPPAPSSQAAYWSHCCSSPDWPAGEAWSCVGPPGPVWSLTPVQTETSRSQNLNRHLQMFQGVWKALGRVVTPLDNHQLLLGPINLTGGSRLQSTQRQLTQIFSIHALFHLDWHTLLLYGDREFYQN